MPQGDSESRISSAGKLLPRPLDADRPIFDPMHLCDFRKVYFVGLLEIAGAFAKDLAILQRAIVRNLPRDDMIVDDVSSDEFHRAFLAMTPAALPREALGLGGKVAGVRHGSY